MKEADKQEVAAEATEVNRPDGQEYAAPAIVWEQEFVALAQTSPPPCQPGDPPPCPQ